LRRPVRLDYSAPLRTPPAPPSNRTVTPPGRVLFVGNIPDGTEEADLREKFTPFGAFKSVRVATRPGAEPRGCVRELRGGAAVYVRPQLARGLSTSQNPRAIGGTLCSNLTDELTGSGFVERAA
ncbi:hypothetical protein K438DRAFT_2028322, partial [Mycena galopus ATCC 62051]